jgi:CheY-like chemotaxis protein
VSKESPAVILCVDDDPMGLAARRMLLSIAGYEVLIAITGETALQMFRCQRVDLVIADHFLPDSTGTEIIAAMKQLKPEVPVVLLTGEMDPPSGSERADLVLTKGMDPPDFLATVAKLLKPSSAKAE